MNSPVATLLNFAAALFLSGCGGEWQWKHYQNRTLAKSELANSIASGAPTSTLPCARKVINKREPQERSHLRLASDHLTVTFSPDSQLFRELSHPFATM